MLNDHRIPPRAGGAADSAADSIVVLLHGLGDSGAGLLDLAPPLAAHLPNAVFYSPDGPELCEATPFGRQWFGLQDWSQDAIFNGAETAAPKLNAYLDEKLAMHRLPPRRLALLGFSQGCMMALHVGLRRTQPLGAIVGFSGALVGPERIAGDVRSRPPVMLIHGMMDTVVPYAAMPASVHYLKAAGVTVLTESRPLLGHSIDGEGLAKAALFLKEHIGTGVAAPGVG